MKYRVSTEILNETKHCSKNFACLSGDAECLCEIIESVSSRVVFVKPGCTACPYRTTFGYSYICSCPTRRELYIRYKR